MFIYAMALRFANQTLDRIDKAGLLIVDETPSSAGRRSGV